VPSSAPGGSGVRTSGWHLLSRHVKPRSQVALASSQPHFFAFVHLNCGHGCVMQFLGSSSQNSSAAHGLAAHAVGLSQRNCGHGVVMQNFFSATHFSPNLHGFDAHGSLPALPHVATSTHSFLSQT
jgi:hypothetical protein